MGTPVYTFVEHRAVESWVEVPRLRKMLDGDVLDLLRGQMGGKRVPMHRGFPHDGSGSLEAAIGDLGDEVSRCSWATLGELGRLPLDEARERQQLVGPLFYQDYERHGLVRGTAWTEGLRERLDRFGARLVSNAEMEDYIAERPQDFAGITDGEAKVFTVLALRETPAQAIGLDDTLDAMRGLGEPEGVRLIWIVGDS